VWRAFGSAALNAAFFARLGLPTDAARRAFPGAEVRGVNDIENTYQSRRQARLGCDRRLVAVRVVIRLACSATGAALKGSSLMRLHQRVNSTVDYCFQLPALMRAGVRIFWAQLLVSSA
jgi:hypothetical protein